jgi:ribosomal protein L12E/L44/L45/RPP1/RPP2
MRMGLEGTWCSPCNAEADNASKEGGGADKKEEDDEEEDEDEEVMESGFPD